jgi:DNA-binding winged helix-turn-helix (wHTH) protein/TolB-like protein/Tfp pilus assembly protein PilF
LEELFLFSSKTLYFMNSICEKDKIYEFADFRLIPSEDLLLHNGEQIELNPKAFAVLSLLVERHGHLVSKSEIMDSIWEDSFVEEGAVSKAVWFARNALGDSSKEKFIQTIPRRGYRFVAPVVVLNDSANGLSRPEEISTGYRITVAGDGEVLVTESGFESGTAEEPLASLTSAEPHHSRGLIALTHARLAAFIVGIMILTALAGYYGFVRKGSADSPRSIAILPAFPTNAEPNRLYVSGIAESIINRIATAQGITVRSLSSVRDYSSDKIDPIVVGQEQRVDYVLTSNYQIADGRIKVTAQLLNVSSGNIEESFQIQQPVADVFAAQDAIAADIGNKLLARFNVSPGGAVKGRGTNSEEAYRLYQQGMLLMDKRRPENSKKAREYFEQAVSLDSNYAKAWAGIAHAIRASGRNDPDRVHQELLEAANKALAIDPSTSDAYVALCLDKLHYAYDFAGAEFACKQAVQVDPNSSTAHVAYSWVLRYTGRYDEALAEIRTAINLEPVSYVNQRDYGYALYRVGRLDEAAAQWKRLLDLDPMDPQPYNQLVRISQAQGKEAEALEWFLKFITLKQSGPETVERYTNVYQTSGWRGVLLERAKDPKLTNGDFQIATLYAHAGEKDKAFEYLEKSFQQREWSFAGLRESPELDSIRDDPRYNDLVRRVEGN